MRRQTTGLRDRQGRLEVYGEDGLVRLKLPTKYEVCPSCEGHGKYVNPAIDGNGITGDEWEEMGEESQEMYLSGGYDVTCEECGGNRVVEVLDESRATPEQTRAVTGWERDCAESRADEAAEARAFGYWG